MHTDGLIVYRRTADIDAIDEHSRRLVDALRERGRHVAYTPTGLPRARSVDRALGWLLLQYNPWSYARWGVAPDLLGGVVALRRRLSGPIALMVHEDWLAADDLKSAIIGGYQRMQLRALSRMVTVVMATTEHAARAIGPSAIHVPVASNITPTLPFDEARRTLGVEDKFVVALFGRGNPSRALDHAKAAIAALVRLRGAENVLVFNLGADAPAIWISPSVTVVSPGRLDSYDLSIRLAASDICLLPFTDGLSTRRTTLMAALAHGVPVLGLRGRASDGLLLQHRDTISMTPAGDLTAYGQCASALATDRALLRAKGDRGRALYEARFSWEHVAASVIAAIENVSNRSAAKGR